MSGRGRTVGGGKAGAGARVGRRAGSELEARAPFSSRGHGAADVASRRRGGGGRVPGVPAVRP